MRKNPTERTRCETVCSRMEALLARQLEYVPWKKGEYQNSRSNKSVPVGATPQQVCVLNTIAYLCLYDG